MSKEEGRESEGRFDSGVVSPCCRANDGVPVLSSGRVSGRCSTSIAWRRPLC
jgi:hypothetical protein